jgi:hypothetical protein
MSRHIQMDIQLAGENRIRLDVNDVDTLKRSRREENES